MKFEILEEKIRSTTISLLDLAEKQCWNKVSKNCHYILTDINALEYSNFHILRKLKYKANSKKKPQDLNSILKVLYEYHNDLYDVVLYVFKAKKNQTIIEIEYLKKSDLDPEYDPEIKDYPTMFHAKISMPTHQDYSRKFDINWQRQNFSNFLKKYSNSFNISKSPHIEDFIFTSFYQSYKSSAS